MKSTNEREVMAGRGSSVRIDEYLWPNRYLLELFGTWPTDYDGRTLASQLFVNFRVCFVFVAITGVLVPEILMIIVYWGDLDVLTGVGCIATPVSLILFKVAYMIIRRNRFHGVYSNLRRLWLAIDDAEEFEPLEELARLAKRVTIGFFLSCFSNNVSFTTAAVIDWVNYDETRNDSTPRHLPFDVWFSFDVERSPNFEIAFGCQVISSLYCCTGIVGIDATMMTFILHICGHFRTIAAKWRAIGSKILDNEKYSKSGQVMPVKKDINQILRQHSEMLRIAEEVRRLLAPIIFMQLLTSGLGICLSVYAVTMNGSKGADLFKFIVFFVSIFVGLIIWCWPGQLLMQDSAALGDVVCYELPWHLLGVAEQRNLAFFIMRAQKECQITALGFQVLSMNKFTEIFNSAGSYFALLRTIHEKQLEAQ
ncbi:odorant receptor 77 isoform X1 [Nasonia vitripennis]|uniref:Odorant receptor n=2 Tax=Nasonia vitripennis TaxID=7425 RepID=A0A7M7PYK5_NASVI|nr:odorant receptor 77 isoform X1 [Nasonia vitripennis]